MSIKPLPPEAIETFSLVLHPKRRYSARKPRFQVPSVASVSPDLGDIYGGAPLTLSVTGIVDSVTINGTPCTSVVQSGTSVTCFAPAKSAGTYNVAVSGPGGTATLTNGYEAWHPTVVYPSARVYQSDQSVTSASSGTRYAMGVRAANYFPATALVGGIDDTQTSIVVASTASFRQATTYELVIEDEVVNVTGVAGTTLTVTRGHAGSVAASHTNGTAVRLSPQDGQTFLELASGRLIIMGGAGYGHAGGPDERVNIIWYSDDRGKTWSVLLGDSAGSSNRPARAHTFGGFKAVFSGVTYVYWLGGDPFYPTGDVFRILASELDVGGNPNAAWELVSTICPTSALALYMYGQLGDDGDLYVIGGQVDINDGAASKKVFKSTDEGATWPEIGTDTVPANVWGQQLGPLPVLDGKFWICGSGRYDSVVNDFSNAVVTFDGVTWTTVLADGHAQFPKTRYHSAVVFNDRLWRFNGTSWDGVTLDPDTAAAHYSENGVTWTAWTDPLSSTETHAQAAVATSDGIYLTDGFQSAKLHVIREYTGALVSQWDDIGGALDLTQATLAKRPLLVSSELGAQPGIAFTRGQFLGLASPDRGLAGGHFEAFFVGKTINFDQSANQSANAPATVIGSSNASSWNNFGFYGDSLIYKAFDSGWQPAPSAAPDGANLNDDRVRLHGVRHENNDVKLYVGTVQQGTTSVIVFDTTWTGWDGFGAGFGNVDPEDDYSQVVLGAAVILTENAASNATFLTKMNKWAKKWGSIS